MATMMLAPAPRPDDPSDDQAGHADGAPPSGVPRDRRVMVVDDDPEIREVISLVLEDEGYEVDAVPHGAAALERIRRDPPGLILLDLMMPVMDGRAFIEAYRTERYCHEVALVVMSAGHGAAHARRLGVARFLAKPFELDELLRTVEEALSRHDDCRGAPAIGAGALH